MKAALESPQKVLLITHCFAPEAKVGVLRLSHLCRYLPEFGYEPAVITIQERLIARTDPSLAAPPGTRVLRTWESPNPLDLYRRWKSGPGSRNGPRTAGAEAVADRARPKRSWRNHLLALLQTPDRNWGWYLPALRAASRMICEEEITALISSGPPWIAHLVARKLKRKYHLPWLADFRDPWAYAPYREALTDWQLRWERRAQGGCIRDADRVLCNTPRLRELFLRFHPESSGEKFVTLPNGFDDTLPRPAGSAQPVSHRLWLHLGSLYGRRRIDTFFQAVAGLIRAGHVDPAGIRIVLMGEMDPAHLEAARRSARELLEHGCLEFRPPVAWAQAQEALWSADLLLLFQGGHNLQVPAKFFEYLQTGKPILAVTEEGALSDLLAETDAGLWAPPDHPEKIAAALLAAQRRQPRDPDEVLAQWRPRFHYRSLAGQLAGQIRGLTQTAPARSGKT